MNDIKTEKFVYLINKHVRECSRCDFGKNGRAYPFFGKKYKYLIVGEAPHTEEIAQGYPFVGDSGNTLWKAFDQILGFTRDEFIIFNSVMCKPNITNGKTIGKPNKASISSCFVKRTDLLSILHDYFNIRNILVLGNYARYIFTGEMAGIDKDSGNTYKTTIQNHEFIITYCLHPASVLYNPTNKLKFEKSIRSFGESVILGVDND